MRNDGLFVMNVALNQAGYIRNVILLALIAFITNFVFINFAIPYAITDDYIIILGDIRFIVLFAYFLVLLSLIDRRMYDIAGTRNSIWYKSVLNISWLTFIVQILNLYCHAEQTHMTEFNASLAKGTIILDIIVLAITIIIAFVPSGHINLDE